jgi:hypothetical protein
VAAAGERWENLRYLLNQWDFLGVADLVDDEYDCMVGPLVSLLDRGATAAEVSEHLWYELDDHFGVDPAGRGVDGMADRLVALGAAWQREPEV